MKISIVTPSYNQGSYLETSILSVWNQEGDFELEHIVVDGSSVDESLEIIKKYDSLYKSGGHISKCRHFSFKWISEQDHGQSDALNKGFAMSSGEILGWINSDDLYASPKSLNFIYTAYLAHDVDVVLGNLFVIDRDGQPIDTPVLINGMSNDAFQHRIKDILKFDLIMQPSCLFKRNVWESVGIKEYSYIMDWVLWIDAYKNGFKFFKIDEYIASYRQQEDAKTIHATIDKNANIKRCEEIISMYKTYGTWCLNRFYYSAYLFLLKASRYRFIGYCVEFLIRIARGVRNKLAIRYKLY